MLTAETATVEQLNVALRRIAEEEQDRSERATERRGASRLPFHPQVQVQLPAANGSLSTEEGGATFTAYIREISGGGVGLIHKEPIPTGRVMLTFKLSSGETISILAELLWRRSQPDGKYSSGGKLIEVMTPVSPREPVTAGAG